MANLPESDGMPAWLKGDLPQVTESEETPPARPEAGTGQEGAALSENEAAGSEAEAVSLAGGAAEAAGTAEAEERPVVPAEIAAEAPAETLPGEVAGEAVAEADERPDVPAEIAAEAPAETLPGEVAGEAVAAEADEPPHVPAEIAVEAPAETLPGEVVGEAEAAEAAEPPDVEAARAVEAQLEPASMAEAGEGMTELPADAATVAEEAASEAKVEGGVAGDAPGLDGPALGEAQAMAAALVRHAQEAAEAPPVSTLPPVEPLELEALVEGLLFVADGAVTIGQLAEALEVHAREVEGALAALAAGYERRGLSLQRFRDRVQLTTSPGAAAAVERFLGLAAATPLSRAALESLAIVAYQQPVTRPQIEAVRGVNSDSVIKNLLSKGLIEEAGRAEGPGRPVLYSTTPEFMQHFGLASLSELPPLALAEAGTQLPTPDQLLKG